MLSRMIDKAKVIKLEICTLKGTLLLTVTKNYTFPFRINDDGKPPENQTIIIKGKNLPVFARNAPVRVIAYTRAGERISYPARIDMSMETQLNIYLRISASEELDDRRRFFKISEEIKCMVISVTRGEAHTDLEPPLPFLIGDINIGGVFLNPNPQIEFANEDTIEIMLEDQRGKAQLTAKVLRVQRRPDEQGTEQITGYGCSFLFLNARQEEIIAGFVNKIQMERRRLELSEGDPDEFKEEKSSEEEES